MTDASDTKFTIFELYLATAEKVTDRRALANSWMLSVNSAIVALYGYLQSDKIGTDQKAIWLWAIPTQVRLFVLLGRRSFHPTGNLAAPNLL
jgi:hypothetical protein